MLQISNYWQAGDNINIDLLPHRVATHWLLKSKQQHPPNKLKIILARQLDKPIANELHTR